MKQFTPILLLGLVALLALSAACAPASRAPVDAPNVAQASSNVASKTAGDIAKGKTLFGSSCGSCHGPDAKGLPNLGKDLTTSAFVKTQADSQLLIFFKTGRPASDPANTTGVDMPPKGGNPALTDTNLQDILAYIRSVNK